MYAHRHAYPTSISPSKPCHPHGHLILNNILSFVNDSLYYKDEVTNMKNFKRIIALILSLTLFMGLLSSCKKIDKGKIQNSIENKEEALDENGSYYNKHDVISYLISYEKLPKNYIRKKEAQDMGWIASEGNLWKVTDKMVIGGDKFSNREEKLPKKNGRIYYEADVNYKGGKRGAERIIYSNDGLIFYTSDHYKTFERIK